VEKRFGGETETQRLNGPFFWVCENMIFDLLFSPDPAELTPRYDSEKG
jgi:hypothetical protein